jgi:hypothetical protein
LVGGLVQLLLAAPLLIAAIFNALGEQLQRLLLLVGVEVAVGANAKRVDHIPPVFGQEKFQHVVAHGPWGRTEKVYMKQLTEFRASADDALHRQIGSRTSRFSISDLPTRASLNALLEGVLDHLPAIRQQEA